MSESDCADKPRHADVRIEWRRIHDKMHAGRSWRLEQSLLCDTLSELDRLDARVQELEMQSRGNWIDAEQENRRANAAEAELAALRATLIEGEGRHE